MDPDTVCFENALQSIQNGIFSAKLCLSRMNYYYFKDILIEGNLEKGVFASHKSQYYAVFTSNHRLLTNTSLQSVRNI